MEGEQRQSQGSSGGGGGHSWVSAQQGEGHRQGRPKDIDGFGAGAVVGAGFRADGSEQGQGCGMGRASGREVKGVQLRREQRDRGAAMRGAMRDGARGCHHCFFAFSRRRCSFTLATLPAAVQSLTYLGHGRRRPELFWPRLF